MKSDGLGLASEGSDPKVWGPETRRYIDRCVQQGKADYAMYVDLQKRIHCKSCTQHYIEYFNRNKHLPPFEFFLHLYNEIQERKIKEGLEGNPRTAEEYAKYLGATLSH